MMSMYQALGRVCSGLGLTMVLVSCVLFPQHRLVGEVFDPPDATTDSFRCLGDVVCNSGCNGRPITDCTTAARDCSQLTKFEDCAGCLCKRVEEKCSCSK
jgi:hypothetical protein